MEKKEFFKVLKKYLDGTASPEEEEFVKTYYNLFELREDAIKPEADAERDRLKYVIKAGLHDNIRFAERNKRIRQLYKKIGLAASILLVSSFIYYFNFSESEKDNTPHLSENKYDIKPGGNKAVLTLSNGETITLDDAKNGLLAKQGNIEINKTADGELTYHPGKVSGESLQYNTVSTPRGGQYQLVLPDGTKVWLNAASSITFPTSFPGASREVEIKGEVYLEVAKNKLKPFRVKSAGQVVEVLGTHFNVNAYTDEESTKTTLLEGSVKVSLSHSGDSDKRSVLLSPGYQAQFKLGRIAINEVDTEAAVAWKDGYFNFNREDIQSVMRQVSRWYDVEVVYQGNVPADEFVGRIPRSSNVSGILRILKLSKVDCRLQGKKIIINN